MVLAKDPKGITGPLGYHVSAKLEKAGVVVIQISLYC